MIDWLAGRRPWKVQEPHHSTLAMAKYLSSQSHSRPHFHTHHPPHNLTHFFTYARTSLSLHLVSELNRITFSANLNSSARQKHPRGTGDER